MRRILFLLPVVVFAGMAIYFAVGLQRDPRIVPSALLDKPAPDFDLPPLLDTTPGLATADLTGEVSMVNVFASWCVPCRAEHPLLMRLAADEKITIHGLNWKDRQADATAWLAELGNPYARIGHDLSGRVGIDWGVYGVPETYVIDKRGRVRYKHVGPIVDWRVMEETILPMVRELEAE